MLVQITKSERNIDNFFTRPRGPRRGFENGHRVGAPVVMLRSSGVLARCCARARRVTPNGPLDGPKTYKLPADKGPLCLVPERRAAQQNCWPAACGELQATAKPRTVGRVSSGQFARSLRRSRVRAQYRARGPRPQVVAAGVWADPLPGDRRRATNAAAQLPQSRGVVAQARWSTAMDGELGARGRAARAPGRSAGCRGARRRGTPPLLAHAARATNQPNKHGTFKNTSTPADGDERGIRVE